MIQESQSEMDQQRSVDIDNDRGGYDSDTEIVTMKNDDNDGENADIRMV